MPYKPRPIKRLLNENAGLRNIQETIFYQNELTNTIRSLLVSPLHNHIASAQIERGILTIYTDTPAWAARLRFQVGNLVQELRPRYPALKTAKIRVLQISNKPKQPLQKARKSSAAARIIHNNALNTKDLTLREALERLSNSLKQD